MCWKSIIELTESRWRANIFISVTLMDMKLSDIGRLTAIRMLVQDKRARHIAKPIRYQQFPGKVSRALANGRGEKN
jgi:hypothetical protein